MHNLKKIFARVVIFCMLLAVIATSSAVIVLAQGQGGRSGQGGQGGAQNVGIQNPLKVNSLSELITKVIDGASYLLIIFAVVAIIWQGMMLVLARGNPEKMKEASARLGYILIGVAIVIGARLLVGVIVNTLDSTGAVNDTTIDSAR